VSPHQACGPMHGGIASMLKLAPPFASRSQASEAAS